MEANFRKEVAGRPGGENIYLCYSCGSCTATCPISELDQEFNPRLIISRVTMGQKKEVLESRELWKCIQCHRCVAHCPQNVKFADILRVLREMAVENQYYPPEMLKDIENVDQALWEYRLQVLQEHHEKKKELKDVISELTSGGEKDG